MDTEFEQWDVISCDIGGKVSTCLVTKVGEHGYTLYYIGRSWDDLHDHTHSILLKPTVKTHGWRKVGYLKLNADFEIET